VTTPPTLATARLTLRPIASDDLDGYAEIWSDPEFTRHIGGRQPDRDAVWHAMAGNVGCWTLTGVGPWSVVERASGELVGRAGLWNEPGWPGVEVVWFIGRPWWGRGYATEAGEAAIAWVFNARPDLTEVVSVIAEANVRSSRVAERLGMHVARSEILHGAPKNVHAISRDAWMRRAGCGALSARRLTGPESAAITGPGPDA
jgi:RimJ/RimL family protein N-acetyltransferase